MNLEIEEFHAKVDRLNDIGELVALLEYQTSDDRECSGVRRLIEKVLASATTVEQLVILYNASWDLLDLGYDTVTFEKMVSLIQSKEDLELVCYVFRTEETELKYRHLLRKVFDKADELGYPTT
jgi:hypothetical protein